MRGFRFRRVLGAIGLVFAVAADGPRKMDRGTITGTVSDPSGGAT